MEIKEFTKESLKEVNNISGFINDLDKFLDEQGVKNMSINNILVDNKKDVFISISLWVSAAELALYKSLQDQHAPCTP